MNIDERIEALTLNLEVMSGMVRDVLKSVDAMREGVDAMRESVDAMRESMDKLKEVSLRDGENIRALARIAEMHERRLTDLEQPG